MKTYSIAEIFYSLQGEGTWAGTPMIFIRFSKCNLKCHFCDTDFENGEDLFVEDIMGRIDALLDKVNPNTPVPICFTGGEPLLQLDTHLMQALSTARGHHFTPLHLETNGTLTPPSPSGFRCITISPKVPVAGNLGGMLKISSNVELKVIWDMVNEKQTMNIMKGWDHFPYKRKFIQPMTNPDGSTNVEDVIAFIKDHPEWHLSMQIQNILKIE